MTWSDVVTWSQLFLGYRVIVGVLAAAVITIEVRREIRFRAESRRRQKALRRWLRSESADTGAMVH